MDFPTIVTLFWDALFMLIIVVSACLVMAFLLWMLYKIGDFAISSIKTANKRKKTEAYYAKNLSEGDTCRHNMKIGEVLFGCPCFQSVDGYTVTPVFLKKNGKIELAGGSKVKNNRMYQGCVEIEVKGGKIRLDNLPLTIVHLTKQGYEQELEKAKIPK